MDYDFLVLGGGSAGYAAARTAVAAGLKTVVVEGGEEIGGLCILRGCMPSKAVIASANCALAVRDAEQFGIQAGAPHIDLKAVIARKRGLIHEFAAYRRGQLESAPFDFIRGFARLTGPHEVQVAINEGETRKISTRSVLLSTGSVHDSPPIPGLADCNPLTSDDILDAEVLPDSVLVLGAGPVALEMAHYMNAMGVAVTIVQRNSQLLTGMDRDLAAVVEAAFRERGMNIFTGTHIRQIQRSESGWEVVFEKDGIRHSATGERIFNGLGRRPATENLGLETLGIATEKGAVKISPGQQTNISHIFAAGDCCGPFEIVHIAIQQGEIAAMNAASILRKEEPSQNVDYRLKLYAVFTEPQLACVGLTEAEAREQNLPVRTATHPFEDHGKSLVLEERAGFVKLLAHANTGEIIGGAVVGPHASELIHEIVVAMAFRSTAAQLAAIPHYHPTLSEIWTYPAEELAAFRT
jgi:pyruvate/2-oxoglutarate dehydrogenase complex dihydrolipoamide dehydrogenase (E3) component